MNESATMTMSDPGVEEGPKSEEEKIKQQIAQTEDDIRYFKNLPSIHEVTQGMDREEIERFRSENNNIDLESDWIFSHEDIERAIRYNVVGDDGSEVEGPNYQDRLSFASIAIPRELLVDGRKLGFTTGRTQIMAETVEAAVEKLERLKGKLSEFQIENMPKVA